MSIIVYIDDFTGLPPECDGHTLEVTFDYIAPELNGRDAPSIDESVNILGIAAGDRDFLHLLKTHKRKLEAMTLAKLKLECEDYFDF